MEQGCMWRKATELKQNYVKHMTAEAQKMGLKYVDINFSSNYGPKKLFSHSLGWQRQTKGKQLIGSVAKYFV